MINTFRPLKTLVVPTAYKIFVLVYLLWYAPCLIHETKSGIGGIRNAAMQKMTILALLILYLFK